MKDYWGIGSADSKVSKHFAGVLQENNLRCLDTNRFLLSSPGMVEECLREFGPIAILGNFGQVGPVRGLGHFVVLAGIKEDAGGMGTRKFKIHDPANLSEDGSQPSSTSTIGEATTSPRSFTPLDLRTLGQSP